MFHWQILAGLIGGLGLSLRQAATPEEGLIVLAGFLACVIGTCAVFYVFFLCRMLGAGDIKLMAICSGILGPWDGCLVIFLGLFLAAARGAGILMAEGALWRRLERLSGFVIRCRRDGRLEEYPGIRDETERVLHLGPYLFMGYCIWLVLQR